MSRDALIVGINHYQYFGKLEAPARDAEAIATRLQQSGGFRVRRYPEVIREQVGVICSERSVTARQLQTALVELFKPQGKQVPETALFYFSGHGYLDDMGLQEGFLAASDANPTGGMPGISLQWLRNLLAKSPVRQYVVILDCCHSGAVLNFDEADPGDRAQCQSRCFLAASRDFESAYEALDAPYSVLTRVLLEELDPENSELGEVNSADLIRQVTQRLRHEIQVPMCSYAGDPIRLTYGQGGKAVAKGKGHTLTVHRGVPLQMPPLPDHFVERPDHQDQVKASLLSEEQKFGTLVVSAIYGLGGIGKSVLASKLAHDQEIQSRFADGILWATLGQSPDILPLLSGWIQSLGDHDYKPTAIESASNHLRTLLYDKRVLLVVDDVWKPEHLEPFRIGGDGCCVLVTTREARIPEAHRYDLDVMTADQSMELMTQKLSEPLSETDQAQALAFAERVGYLPLALELAASQIEEGVTWQELFEDFQSEVARLEGLDLYGQEEIPDDAKRRKYSLLACFNLSLKQLSTEQLRQFAWLGIVPEDVSLTQEMAMTLWQVTSRQAGSILRTFRSKALVLQGAKQQGERASYRMHDLMHDLAQRLLVSSPQPLRAGDLPGLGMTKAEAHSEFINRYRAKTHQGQWHTLEDDGYIYAHLTWHMEQAKQPKEIQRLLQASNEQGRNGWYEACDAIGKPAGFVNDVGRAWKIAVENYEQAPSETMALLFRYALMRTSINSLASNVPAELVGALVKHGIWQAAQGLAYAQQAQDPWHRSACISAIVPYIPRALLTEVLKTIAQIKDAAYRSYVLGKLAERFPEVWSEVLAAIRQIHDRYGNHRHNTKGFSYRALALQELLEALPLEYLPVAIDIARNIQDVADRAMALTKLAERQAELLPEALKVTRQIQDESSRASALRELSKQLPELLPEALKVTRQIQDESSRAYALRELSKHLPELLPEALEVTRQSHDESSCAYALSALSKHLPELLPEALKVTRQIQDEWSRADVLRELAKHLPPELLPEALEVTRQIQDESSRAYALSELSKHLLPGLLPEALKVTRQIQDEWSRASALSALSKQLPELLPEALEVTRQIQAASSRASALRELSKHLPPELLPEALEVTRQIQDESSRAYALRELSKQLPELLSEALEVTRQIQDESSRAYALRELSKQLPELLSEALEVTRQIQDESSRAYALRELSKQLPELLPEALEVTRQIQNESSRADVLRELSKHLPSELLPEALMVTHQIQDEWSRASALSELSKHLPPELLPEALVVTRQIQDKSSRASALSALSKHLPELLSEALEVTRQIQDEWSRAYSLSELSKQLPELLPEALEVTRQIQDEWSRASVLRELSKQLPELLPEALAVTRQIQDEWSRAFSLSALSKHLPPELLPEALEVTRQIQDESRRAYALSALSKHLPPELLPAALAMVWLIQDNYYRANALSGFLPYLQQLSVTVADWVKMLDILAYQNRSNLIQALPDIQTLVMALGDDQAFPATLQAVREICQQWP